MTIYIDLPISMPPSYFLYMGRYTHLTKHHFFQDDKVSENNLATNKVSQNAFCLNFKLEQVIDS